MTDTTALDLDAIRARAEAATPGPWEFPQTIHGDPFIIEQGKGRLLGGGIAMCDKRDDYGRSNAAHIAGMDPTTTLALVDEVERIRSAIEELNDDESWHVGGAWGDYGEIVIPLRALDLILGRDTGLGAVDGDRSGYVTNLRDAVEALKVVEAERDEALATAAAGLALADGSETYSIPVGESGEIEVVFARRLRAALGEVEAGDCGGCTKPEDFDWSPVNLPNVEGAVMVCKHGGLAPGWAYDSTLLPAAPSVECDEALTAVKSALDEYCTAGCCQHADGNEKLLHDRLRAALGEVEG